MIFPTSCAIRSIGARIGELAVFLLNIRIDWAWKGSIPKIYPCKTPVSHESLCSGHAGREGKWLRSYMGACAGGRWGWDMKPA